MHKERTQHNHTNPNDVLTEFRHHSAMGIAVIGSLLITPFVVNHLVHGRWLLGLVGLLFVSLMSFNVWTILARHRYYPTLNLLGLGPVVILFLVLAITRQGLEASYWSYPAVLAMYFILPERQAWLANAMLLAITLPIIWLQFEPNYVLRLTATLLIVSGSSAILIRVITRQQTRLSDLASQDPLTGVLNRSRLRDLVEESIESFISNSRPATLLALDLDHFKQINDAHGHGVGDQVLVALADILRQVLPAQCPVIRMGGEEFLILMRDADLAQGRKVAEQLRATMAGAWPADLPGITVSIGVADVQPGDDWSHWIGRADKCLYRAKGQGRDQVIA